MRRRHDPPERPAPIKTECQNCNTSLSFPPGHPTPTVCEECLTELDKQRCDFCKEIIDADAPEGLCDEHRNYCAWEGCDETIHPEPAIRGAFCPDHAKQHEEQMRLEYTAERAAGAARSDFKQMYYRAPDTDDLADQTLWLDLVMDYVGDSYDREEVADVLFFDDSVV